MELQTQDESMPWKPWLSRFKKFLTVLIAVLIAILVTSGWIPTLAVARTGRYILSFFGIMSLAGATFNGGIAFAFCAILNHLRGAPRY
jgi:hypothetical protein